tara:strand:+ start:424 stop:2178 length:1755 start_codon:yes stop_codon:yes gene_type:complete
MSINKFNLNVNCNLETTKKVKDYRYKLLVKDNPQYKGMNFPDLKENLLESKIKKRMSEDIDNVRILINNSTDDDHNSINFWNHIWDNTIIDWYKPYNTYALSPSKDALDEIYKDTNYMLFNSGFFLPLLKKINQIYNNSYKDQWVKTSPSFISEMYFVQKVKIDNPNSKIHFIGDIHSSFHSLGNILRDMRESFIGETMKLKSDHYIFFTGDLLDRGPYSLEVLWCALNLKQINPTQVYIVKGNHENVSQYNRRLRDGGGTGDEMRYQLDHETINEIKKTLYYLPVAIFLNFNGSTFQVCHGAFDTSVCGWNNIEQKFTRGSLKMFLDNVDNNITLKLFDNLSNTNQFQWGDFYIGDNRGYRKGGRWVYYNDITRKYLKHHNIESIISGHQDNISFGIMPPSADKLQVLKTEHGSELKYDEEDHLIVLNHLDLFKKGIMNDSYTLNINPSNLYFNSVTNETNKIYNSDLPQQDMLACILSSCVASKIVYYRSFATLELSSEYLKHVNIPIIDPTIRGDFKNNPNGYSNYGKNLKDEIKFHCNTCKKPIRGNFCKSCHSVGLFKNKYLKYKNKYLKLKKQMKLDH